MKRWTIQRLNELDDKSFAICILQERLNGLSNPYSPLATKLAHAIRHLTDEGFCCEYTEKEDE